MPIFLLLLFFIFLSFSSNAQNDSLIAEKLISSGREKIESGDSSAISDLNNALNISRQKNLLRTEIKALYYIGFSKRTALDFSGALELYLPLLKQVKASQQTDLEYDILSEIGYIYYNIGEYKEAFSYYESSLKIAEQQKDKKKIAFAYGNLGVLSEQWGYLDNAQYYYNLAYSIQEELRDTSGLVNTLNNSAVAFLSAGNTEKAVEAAQKAIKLAKKSGYLSGVVDANINLGVILSESGNYLASITSNREALQIAKSLNRESDVQLALENLADNFFNLGEYTTAQGYAQQALVKAEAINSPEGIKASHELLYKIYEKTGNLKLALFHLTMVSNYKDSLSKNDLSVQVAKLDERNQIKRQIEEEKRKEEERALKEQEERNRISNIQYFIIMSISFMVVFGIFFARKYSVNLKFIEILLFISILMFFEFIGILIDPFTESFSGGFPLPKLAINLVLAIVIFFLDEYFDKKIKEKILKKS